MGRIMKKTRALWIIGFTFLLLFGRADAETFSEQLTEATFKVFNSASTGTGFLLQDSTPGAARTNVILVSAAHAFQKAKGDHVLLVCRVKDDHGQWQRLDHKVFIRKGTNALWTCHPSQDVAVIRCTLPQKAVFTALPQNALADETAARAAGVTVGSRVTICGYPHRIEANKAGFPLLREGIVSGYPLFPASQYPTVFFSASTFPGDSGAPVAIERSGASLPLIIGLIINHTQQNQTLKSDDLEMTIKRDINLGSFLQAVFIRETLALLK